MMSGEHITREDIVEMFSSLPDSTRASILVQLGSAITETELEAQDGCIPEDLAAKSLKRLILMQECCQQAHDEFKDLNIRKPPE